MHIYGIWNNGTEEFITGQQWRNRHREQTYGNTEREEKVRYTETRKMVLKNLFSGQQWRNRHREQIYGHEERGWEDEMYGTSSMETYYMQKR